MADRAIALVNDAIRFELDVAHAYREAAEACSVPDFRALLERRAAEHEDHATRLAPLVEKRGGRPAERRDLTGLLMAASVRIGVDHDDEAARAMRRNEERLATVYETALFDPQPKDVRRAFQRHLDEHRTHMFELDAIIRERGWQEVPPPWPVP
jgi:uncharacterized protein (TIGR02284 family)